MEFLDKIAVFLVFALLFYNVYRYFHSNNVSTFQSEMNRKRIDIVIARYSETLNWMCDSLLMEYFESKDVDTHIYIYDKGTEIPLELCDSLKKLNLHYEVLPNVGRCDHTYLYHIIKYYDNLADVTIFLPGSGDMNNKIERTIGVIIMSYRTLNSAYYTSPASLECLYDFHMDDWISTNEKNRFHNPDSTMLWSDIRPFGDWFVSIFGYRPISHCIYAGIFSASRKDIRNTSVEMYKKLLNYVNTHNNPEAGHYVERVWYILFNP